MSCRNILRNIKLGVRETRKEIARRYLNEAAAEHLKKYPQLCCYSFDGIGIALNIDGRNDAAALQLLGSLIDLRGKDVVDVGANIGNHTIALSEKARHVYAFEPHPVTHKLLQINTATLPNVSIYRLGASNRVGTVQAVSPKSNMGASTITERAPETGETGWSFDVAPLDTIEGLDNIGLIKIDVEGHEFEALEGMETLIARSHPAIVLEQNSDAIDNGTSKSLEYLRRLGYNHFYSIDLALPWRTPQRLPKILRRVGRVLESILFGPADWMATLTEVRTLEPRNYPMLLASPLKLEA